jgi:hypothetical protein
MATPTAPMFGLFGRIKTRQQHFPIQFDEGRVRKLGASLGPGAPADGTLALLRPQLMEERVQVALDGFSGFLKQEKHEDRKRQKTLSSKVCGASAMTRTEIRGENPGANLLDEMKPTSEWRCRCVLHPHVESKL